MSIRQIKRGSTAAVAAYTPYPGELVLDTTLNRLYVGNGSTVGGVRVGAEMTSQACAFLLAASAAAQRTTLGAAASGANTDITSITGTAAAWSTPRTLTVSGDASGSVSIKGDAAMGLALTLATVPVAKGGTGATDAATARTNLGAAPLASPTFTGTPSGPTPAVGTNTTQLATTAMVQAELTNKRAWTSYTPVVSATSGTFTTVTATGRYMVALGICHVQMQLTFTTVGTGTGPVATLPVPALSGSFQFSLMAREGVVNGKLGAALIQAGLGSVYIADYANGTLVTGNGATVYINGSYPVA